MAHRTKIEQVYGVVGAETKVFQTDRFCEPCPSIDVGEGKLLAVSVGVQVPDSRYNSTSESGCDTSTAPTPAPFQPVEANEEALNVKCSTEPSRVHTVSTFI